MHAARDSEPHPPLPFPEPLETGDRWVFSFEREGGATVERQGVIAHVRPGIEVVLYIGPRRHSIPWSEVPAAFAGASRGMIRSGRVVPAGAPPASASASFPRLPPREPDLAPLPPPVVAEPVLVAAEPASLPEPPPPQPAPAPAPAPAAPSERPRRGKR